jgi:uncharacterized repeat protein (TIGR03803 family)
MFYTFEAINLTIKIIKYLLKKTIPITIGMLIMHCLMPTLSQAQYTNLHNFSGATADGEYPTGDLVSYGNFLYGMTYEGGIHNLGTIFKIRADSTGYSKLFDFDSIHGSNPQGSLISYGNCLYGMTYQGGKCNMGTIFKITPSGTLDTLYSFSGYPTSGERPAGSLISIGSYLYGVTVFGGTHDLGCLFKIMPDGSNYNLLHSFSGYTGDGSYPENSLITDGTYIYGMTPLGGSNDLGTIFRMMPDGSNDTILHSFTGSTSDGSLPKGSLIYNGSFLYGMTFRGGANDYGTVFRIKTNGSNDTLLYSFTGDTSDGSLPLGSLIFSGTFLYGMTWTGGISGGGTIFKIKPNGTNYSMLYSFTGTTTSGLYPKGSFISDGTYLYGMTSIGGTYNHGTIFKYSYCTNAPLTISESPPPTYNGTTWSLNIYPTITIGTGTSITATTNQDFKFSNTTTVNGPFSSGTVGTTLSIVPTPCP